MARDNTELQDAARPHSRHPGPLGVDGSGDSGSRGPPPGLDVFPRRRPGARSVRWVDLANRLSASTPPAIGRPRSLDVSFGGLVAAWYAARRPDRVSQARCRGQSLSRAGGSTTSRRATRVTRGFRCRSSPCGRFDAWRPSCLRRCPGWARGFGSALAYAAQSASLPGVSSSDGGMSLTSGQRTDLVSMVSRVTAPTLVITGEAQPGSRRAGVEHARIPHDDSRRHSRPTTAHRPPRVPVEADASLPRS